MTNTPVKNFTTAKRIAVILGILVSTGGIVAIIDQYAPWAWAGEFKEVAGMSCTASINQRWDMILILDKHIDLAKTPKHSMDLRRQKQRLVEELENIKRKCQKYYQ